MGDAQGVEVEDAVVASGGKRVAGAQTPVGIEFTENKALTSLFLAGGPAAFASFAFANGFVAFPLAPTAFTVFGPFFGVTASLTVRGFLPAAGFAAAGTAFFAGAAALAFFAAGAAFFAGAATFGNLAAGTLAFSLRLRDFRCLYSRLRRLRTWGLHLRFNSLALRG